MIGKTISHYKIIEKLGEGGMGVVYKAEDTKLERTVALKFLSLTSIGDEEKKRFKREAKAAASLNHPNIATVFAIDEAEDQTFIAMEYIEGQSLQELVGANGGKPMPIDKAIDYATQTAAGLQAAHKKGITHRDIKSANIMITEDGQIKIMDFGLAKLANRSKLTQLGTTLGTAAYMSPEQARGETVDHRADIWSLGVVLYEMISGQMPFKGDYEQAVIYSIQNEEPEPLTALRTGVPIALDGIIAKALAKEADTRYQHVDELPADLKALDLNLSGTSRISTVAKATGKQPAIWQRWLPWGIAALMTFIAATWWVELQRPNAKPVMRWNLNIPEEAPLALVGAAHAGGGQTALALSTDGSLLVYVALRNDGQTQLYLRALDRFEASPIPGTEGAYSPFFSPDGIWIGFFADNKIKKVSLQTEVVETLCGAVSPYGATWSLNDRIIFVDRDGTALSWVPASGGDVERIPTLPGMRFSPSILPDGDHVLVPTNEGITVVSLLTGKTKLLASRGAMSSIGSVRYVETGHLVFGQPGRLTAVPFDLDRLDVTGQPIPVLDHVRTEVLLSSAAQYAVSSAATLVYVSGGSASVGELVWVDHDSVEEPLPFPPALYGTYRLSADGRRLAVAVLENKWDVYIYDLERSTRYKLTAEGNNRFPIWTKDCAWVVFASDRHGKSNLYLKRADGTGETERLTTSDNLQYPAFFSPDGRLLAFSEITDTTSGDIWILPIEGDHAPQPYRKTSNNEYFPIFSPDGKYLAYTSDASGQLEVYMQPYPDSEEGVIEQISVGGGYEPVWSSFGKELFYHIGNRWMVVSIETEPEFRAGQPKLFVEGPYLDIGGLGWDLSKDGRRLLLVKGSDVSTASHLNVVVNWFEELKRLVPGGE